MSLREALLATPFGDVTAAEAEEVEVVGFSLVPQEKTNWCWAAVALSVAKFRKSVIVETQCRIVELASQCGECQSAKCNQPGDVAKALELQHITAEPHDKAPDFEPLFQEIGAKRPVICRVLKEPEEVDALPHVVVVTRASRSNERVDVKDPATGAANGISYAKFFQGTWFLRSFAKQCIDHFTIK